MTDKELLDTANAEMKDFAESTVANLQAFADEHNYEFAWCVDKFRTAFAAALKNYNE